MKKNYLRKINFTSSFDATVKISIYFKKIVLLFLVVFGMSSVFGQTNDCATSGAAGQLTVGTSCNPVTFNSTNNTNYWNNATGCNSADEDDAWGWFDAIATSTTITYTPDLRDAILHLFTGSCATTMTHLACSDTGISGEPETITYATTIGVRYLIRIQRYNSSANMTGTICVYSPTPPTITNLLTASSGCVGSSITITGTNFTGATAANVKIGGTAVSSITSNNGTTIVAVVGAGTTGTVSVTTASGTATSIGTFTVNPLPTNPANPTSNSPQCNPPGVTLTRAATPPGTENYYWQTSSLGTSTTNNANTYIATTSGTYYIRAQTISTGCWSAGQGSLAVVVDTAISTLATSPSPSNAATGICYAGSSPTSSISWTAAAGATSYDVYFGAGSLPGSITSNVTTTSYSTGTLLMSTTYYWKIVPKNACGITSGSPITWTFTTTAAPCSCTPTGNIDCTLSDYISNVTFNSLNNTTTCGAGGYTVYSASGTQTTTLVTGQTYTFNLSVGSGSGTHGAAVWIDFNQNGVYTDAGEYFLISNAITPSTTTPISITIPAGASLGTVSIRVRYAYNVTITSAMSCTMSGTYGETEDYIITLIAPVVCTTPIAQPTVLNLTTVTSTSINGSFTAASPAPSGYLIVRSSSTTPPTLTNGTTYALGYTGLTPGTTYVIQGSAVTSNAVTFSDSGLSSNTRYYYYIYSYNNACTGAPAYLNTTPLTSNTVTCAAAPTSPVNSAIATTSCTISWTASVAGGGIGAISYTLEIYTDSVYTLPIAGSPFSVGTAITYSLSGLNGGTVYYYRIKANNGTCDSPYLTGDVTTTITNDNCSSAIPLTVNPSSTCTVSTTSSTVGATQSQAGCAGTADDDVWFSFVATGTSHTVTVTPTTLTNVVFQLFTGPCGSLGAGICVDNTNGANAETTIFTGMTTGATYYVRVYSRASGSNQGAFTICITSPPTNDDCSGAIPLTVSSTCSYSTYSNIGATATTGITDPSCGFYVGGDVWFSAVVPATGVLTIDTQTGGMTDGDIELYSGTCGSLNLLDCDDFSSSNGLMAYLSLTGLTPGSTIYIRLWGYGGDTGSFGICATTPSCPSPSDLYSNILSTTSVTVGWTSSPSASGGYQYYINTTGTPPTAATVPTGSTAAGVISVTLTGLTSGIQYYFWVRSFCGGIDVSTWYGPTNYTPCAVGNGTGTTTLGCTSPITGGLGLSGADPVALSCSSLTCPTLEVSYLPLKATTDYTVTSIPYSPPYQYTCLQNPVSVNVDDVWSSTINLPFNFCFYGNNYNKCLIGSNGVITFDTVTYAPGGYNGWSITSNLPNASLFRNTIFGVYQDIDPSKGGQVGWELITLNTGCRALVASWNEIPMYSSACNNKYYTGMMVLYENTNIIDVYIKQKQNCGTWNGGNAIVGVQNAAGTAAVVAPGRNALDTNWTVPIASGEAWRFTPNGPSINPTVQWYQGTAAPANIIAGATGATYTPCPTITTTYTAEVTYPLCTGNLVVTDNAVVTVNGNKIWTGATDTNWNVGTNWTPNGVPTNANCVVVPVVGNGRYPILSGAPNGLGYNLAVNSNASLTVGANQNLIITDKITVQSPSTGAFTVNNNANLLQINDTAINTGSIFYKRIAPNIKGSDYVYWSSPVLNQNMGSIYDGTFPYASGYKYQWNPILNNGNGAGGNIGQGLWEAASGIMTRARGYIIRGSSSFGMPASSIPTTFNGVPFNGIIPYTVQRGAYTGAPYNGANTVQITNLNDNYNLLGNPYPSSINALKFLELNTYNASTNPTGVILGNVKLWTHGTDPLYGVPNPFYGSFLYNYDANDYLTINYLGTTVPGAPDIIKSGQAFFVQMIDGPTGSGTVNFNNSMRFDASNIPYSNSGFYRNGNTAKAEISIERHRIWLDIVDANNQSSGILVGYATDATNNYDTLFDAPTAVPSSMKLFSMIEDDSDVYEIQGRTLPFNVNDEIPIGIMAPTQGNYTFALAAVDGLFDTQSIYLKDNLLNITHDLKSNPYPFNTTSGVVKDRFKIVYIDNALGNLDYSVENNIKVIVNNEVVVSTSNLNMESIVVYNVLGQKLATYKGLNTNYFTLSNLRKNNTTLLLNIKLQTGETVIKKIIY